MDLRGLQLSGNGPRRRRTRIAEPGSGGNSLVEHLLGGSPPGVYPRKTGTFVFELCGKVYGTWGGRYYHNTMKHGEEIQVQRV